MAEPFRCVIELVHNVHGVSCQSSGPVKRAVKAFPHRQAQRIQFQRLEEIILGSRAPCFLLADEIGVSCDNDKRNLRTDLLDFPAKRESRAPLQAEIRDYEIHGGPRERPECFFRIRSREHRAVFPSKKVLKRREDVFIVVKNEGSGLMRHVRLAEYTGEDNSRARTAIARIAAVHADLKVNETSGRTTDTFVPIIDWRFRQSTLGIMQAARRA